jgi:hypothetical protein
MDSTNMMDRFTELIWRSRLVLPSKGEYRRLNRLAFRAPVPQTQNKTNPRHSFVLVTTCLALMVLFSGSLNELGSYDGALDSETVQHLTGKEKTWYSQRVGTVTFSAPDKLEDEDIPEYHRAIVADEYEVLDITCVTVDGKSNWSKHVLMNVNGKSQEGNRWMDDIKSDPFDEKMQDFYRLHMGEVMAKVRSSNPDETGKLETDGHIFAMIYWHLSFPRFGKVTYAKGTPVGEI